MPQKVMTLLLLVLRIILASANEEMKRFSRLLGATKQQSEKQKASVIKSIAPKKVDKKSETYAQSKDFFGRIITKEQVKQRAEEKAQREPPPLIVASLWFKFNEGYSNAVRRKVRVQDLL